jgi:hypothetical protein
MATERCPSPLSFSGEERMSRGRSRSRRSAREWRSLISRQERSGLSQAAFCEREGIALATFAKWKRRVKARAAAAEFVEVTPRSESVEGWELEVTLPKGVVLRVRG